MKYTYQMHPGADKDLAEAYAWYEDSQLGLGERFIRAVLKKIDTITSWPDRSGIAVREKDTRKPF